MHLLVLIWEASQSISEARLNSEIHKQPKCPEWRLQSIQPQTEHVYCNLFLLRLQGYLLKRAWRECTSLRCTLATRKQCVSDTPEQMHKCNPRGWKSTHETRASPRQPNASIDMTVWRETSCLALELLSTPAAARGRDRFSLIVSSLVRGLCSSGSPHIHGYFSSTNFWSQRVRLDLGRAGGGARMWCKHAVWYSQRTIKRHPCPAVVYSKTTYTREGMIRKDEGGRGRKGKGGGANMIQVLYACMRMTRRSLVFCVIYANSRFCWDYRVYRLQL